MRIKMALVGFCLLIAAVSAQNTYIPFELGGDNYYTMYGSPDISAGISGTDDHGLHRSGRFDGNSFQFSFHGCDSDQSRIWKKIVGPVQIIAVAVKRHRKCR